MPKASTRKKRNRAHLRTSEAVSPLVQQPVRVAAQRRAMQTTATAFQAVLMPALVALGCWGLALSFIFFSTDPNRLLLGTMAALMGLIWLTISILRLRKMRR